MPSQNTMELDAGEPTDNPGSVPSRAEMAASRLADEVVARRTSLGIKREALVRATGLSRKTLRDIEQAHRRTYGSDTLGKLDGPLGWRAGHAYDIWREEPGPDLAGLVDETRALVDERTAHIARLLARQLELPVWAPELIDACRLLSPEDRAQVLDFARRLSR